MTGPQSPETLLSFGGLITSERKDGHAQDDRRDGGRWGPVLVVIGARDPFGAVWADDAARPFRSARLTKRVLPLAGHFLWPESSAFLPLVRSFLDRT